MKRPQSKRPEADPRRVALDLLARREHSAAELRRKLIRRGVAVARAGEVVAGLAGECLQSDARFTENYAASRSGRGYGPLRIIAELRQRGVSDELIARFLHAGDPDWAGRAHAVRRKRFGAEIPAGPGERARQARFLHYRGFTSEQIHGALGPDDTE